MVDHFQSYLAPAELLLNYACALYVEWVSMRVAVDFLKLLHSMQAVTVRE